MTQYRKLIVALVGVAIAILTKHFGTDAEIVVDAELVATALGVWGVPNTGAA